MTEAEAAWLAGIFEGEACFDWNGHGKRYPRIRIEMKDYDVIERASKIAGCTSSIRHITRVNPKWNDTYQFQMSRKEQVKEVLTAIRPWMSERRGTLIDEMLEVLAL